MIQSLNTKADLVIDGNSCSGISSYGKIMIGDKGFEFYAKHNKKNFIQIPWAEVDCVIASIMFKGKWIPRYAIKTKRNGTYAFSSKDPKKVLRTIRMYIEPDKIVKSLSFVQVLTRNIKGIFIKEK